MYTARSFNYWGSITSRLVICMGIKMKEILQGIAGEERVWEKESMARHTTFGAGGEAKYYVVAEDVDVLRQLLQAVAKEKLSFFVIGNGSNLLVSDDGYDGVVIELGDGFKQVKATDGKLKAGAGVMLSRAAGAARENGMKGMEFASGIPGTVGGAVVMNAGAYGGEIKDIIVNATVLNRYGEIITLTKEALDLSYRHSVIPEQGYIVLEAEFSLQGGNKEEIGALMREYNQRRKEKQPLEYPSAGSTFKRPEGYYAGKLIQDSGLAGYSVGGAQVSKKHCGFVINENHATASDIIRLIKDVQRIVLEKQGVKLQPEVKIIGEKSNS